MLEIGLNNMIDPNKDGIDHINIYSKGKTALGKFLSNFTQCDVETKHGEFGSIEAYWYWLLAGLTSERVCYKCDGDGVIFASHGPELFGPCAECNRESLRYLSGFEAKKAGKKICGIDYPAEKDQTFQDCISEAVGFKIENSAFRKEFVKSKLPFAHYYVYSGKVMEPTSGRWVIEHIEQLRKEYGKMSSL